MSCLFQRIQQLTIATLLTAMIRVLGISVPRILGHWARFVVVVVRRASGGVTSCLRQCKRRHDHVGLPCVGFPFTENRHGHAGCIILVLVDGVSWHFFFSPPNEVDIFFSLPNSVDLFIIVFPMRTTFFQAFQTRSNFYEVFQVR